MEYIVCNDTCALAQRRTLSSAYFACGCQRPKGVGSHCVLMRAVHINPYLLTRVRQECLTYQNSLHSFSHQADTPFDFAQGSELAELQVCPYCKKILC